MASSLTVRFYYKISTFVVGDKPSLTNDKSLANTAEACVVTSEYNALSSAVKLQKLNDITSYMKSLGFAPSTKSPEFTWTSKDGVAFTTFQFLKSIGEEITF